MTLMQYKDLPKETQNLISPDEFDILNQLQSDFKQSSHYLQEFFQGNKQQLYLDIIVHQWLGLDGSVRHRSKDVLERMKLASKILKKLEKGEKK